MNPEVLPFNVEVNIVLTLEGAVFITDTTNCSI